MLELATVAGCAAPEIEEHGGCVIVRFRSSRYTPPRRMARDLTERQQLILGVLAESPNGLALREIIRDVEGSLTERQARRDLDEALRVHLALTPI